MPGGYAPNLVFCWTKKARLSSSVSAMHSLILITFSSQSHHASSILVQRFTFGRVACRSPRSTSISSFPAFCAHTAHIPSLFGKPGRVKEHRLTEYIRPPALNAQRVRISPKTLTCDQAAAAYGKKYFRMLSQRLSKASNQALETLENNTPSLPCHAQHNTPSKIFLAFSQPYLGAKNRPFNLQRR